MKTSWYFIPVLLVVASNSYSQTESQSDLRHQFDNVIDRWFTTIDKGDLKAFESLLTDDFQLIVLGKRYNKSEILEMSKDYADVKYQLSNVRFQGSDVIGYVTFNIALNCKLKGNAFEGRAIETYLLRKEGNEWKVNTKVVVPETGR